jgi:hypothetical protein
VVDHLAQLEGLPNAAPASPATGPATSDAGGGVDAETDDRAEP